jgi:hypothetical protein
LPRRGAGDNRSSVTNSEVPPMPTPMEICLEDLDLSPEDERYVRFAR